MTKISDLSAVTTLLDTDEMVLARSATTKKIDVVDLRADVTGWTSVVKGSDESVASSATLQNDDALFFTAVSGAIYEIHIHIVYGSPAGAGTPDLKYAYGEDATFRGMALNMGLSDGEALAANFIAGDQTSTVLRGTAAANRSATCQGMHWGNGGTYRLLWAQNSSGVNATIVRAGSVLRYRRIV